MKNLFFSAVFMLVSLSVSAQEEKTVVQELTERTVVVKICEPYSSIGGLKPQIFIANGSKEAQTITLQNANEAEKFKNNLKIIASVIEQINEKGYTLISTASTMEVCVVYIFVKD